MGTQVTYRSEGKGPVSSPAMPRILWAGNPGQGLK